MDVLRETLVDVAPPLIVTTRQQTLLRVVLRNFTANKIFENLDNIIQSTYIYSL
jgi:hypothetical protein